MQLLNNLNFISPYIELPKKLTVKQNLEVYGRLYDIKNLCSKIDYLTLRKIKKDKYKSIAVSKIPNKGLGKTINDRLKRASRF